LAEARALDVEDEKGGRKAVVVKRRKGASDASSYKQPSTYQQCPTL